MRYAVVPIAVAAVLLSATCSKQNHPAPVPRTTIDAPGLGDKAYQHVAALCAFGPRHTGSEGWKRAVDYIAEHLEQAGVAVRRDTWTDQREGVTFTNVIGTLPGRSPHKILLGCHHDTKCTEGHESDAHNFDFVGANDSGSGVGLLLALAAHLAKQPQAEATYEFAFFDGEESIPYEWDIQRALFGSRRYLSQYRLDLATSSETPTVRALVLLDMVGAKDLTIDRETSSTPALLDVFARAAEATGHRRYFFENSMSVTDDHTPFLRAGIPAIDLIDIADNPQWHTPDDTLEHISAQSLQIVGEVVLAALPEVARRFPAQSSKLVLPPAAGRNR